MPILLSEQFYSPNSRTRAVATIGTESKYTVSHEVITQLEKAGKCASVTAGLFWTDKTPT